MLLHVLWAFITKCTEVKCVKRHYSIDGVTFKKMGKDSEIKIFSAVFKSRLRQILHLNVDDCTFFSSKT